MKPGIIPEEYKHAKKQSRNDCAGARGVIVTFPRLLYPALSTAADEIV